MIMQSMVGLKLWAQAKFNKLLRDEKGEVNIVAIVILIGIAVALAIIFRKAILNLIKSLLNQITGSANEAIQRTDE